MDFNDNQKEVIKYGEGCLLVEAGPGSGKTTVIVERIKHLILDCNVAPESFLVITFTTKAAENLKFKLRKSLSNDVVLKMQISTIHSFCLDYLKSKNIQVTLLDDDTSEKKTLFIHKFRKQLGFTDESTVLDYQISAVLNKFGEYTCFNVDSKKLAKNISDSRVISKEYIDFVNSKDYFSKKRIDDYDRELKKLKKEDPDKYGEWIEHKKSWYNARYLQVAKAYPTYLKLMDEYDYVDYDTLQLKALEELEKDSETNYKTIFVDEFQDTDPLQFRIFQILKEKCDYFTAVGDVDQHIYAFRSSFNDFFDELIKLENLDTLSLDVNYRSTENIVRLTEAFITPQRKETSKKHMRSNEKGYNNPNFLIENENSNAEAQKVFEIIQYLKENHLIQSYGDVAVLYRKHSDKTLAALIEKFNENEIEYSIRGQSNLAEQNEVKSIILLLWYVSRKTDFGYVPSKDELKELNLKAFCGEYFKPSFFSLNQSTISYLNDLQDSYYDEILKIENEFRKSEGKKTVTAVHNVKNNENQETLVEIFKHLKLPEIDLNKVHENDRLFFEKLNKIKSEIQSENPPTILNVFYSLISLSNLYGIELTYNQIANIALLSQTISNYESFISETNVRGALFFLRGAIKNYESYQKEYNGVQLMTIHSAKGLEFPVVIITSLEKDKFPMISKDPNREKDYIFPNDTFYTPNEYLKFKTILKEDENGEFRHMPISIEEENELDSEEEDRILYVAMTRAADLLILSTIGEPPQQVDWIRNNTVGFNFDDLSQVEIHNHYETPDNGQVILNYSKYTKYLSCPFKYDLGYNLGFARQGIKAANRGTVFHEIMEDVNLLLKDGQKVSEEELLEITHDAYKSMFDIEDNLDEYDEFKTNVINYFEKYSLNHDVLDAELDFEIDKEKYLLNGSIDLVYRQDDGEIVILDYKYAEYDEAHIDGYTKQLYIYAAAMREIPQYRDVKVKKAITHFVLNDHQHVVEIDEDVMDNELAGLERVASEIGQKNPVFAKKPDNPENCLKCSYRYFCKPKEFAGELYENND